MFRVRALDRKRDRAGVEAIDTAFETSSIFELVASDRAIELVERPLQNPMVKRYSIGEVFFMAKCSDRAAGGSLEPACAPSTMRLVSAP